jgi:hypothetical protein
MSIILYPLLAVLILFSLILLVPLLAPLRSSLLPLFTHLTIPSYILLALSSALLVSSYASYSRYLTLTSSASAHSGSEYFSHSARQAEAERDCVLSVAVLMLLGFIVRLCSLLRDHQSLNNRFIAMEKQARGASAAYLQTLPSTATAASASSSASSSLQTQLEQLTADKTQLEKRLLAMERQARSASDAFLASDSVKSRDVSQQLEVAKAALKAAKDDNARLKEQLEDFNLVLGDAKKKKM